MKNATEVYYPVGYSNEKIASDAEFSELIKNIPEEFLYFLRGYEINLSNNINTFDFMLSVSRIGHRSLIFLKSLLERLLRQAFFDQTSNDHLIRIIRYMINDEYEKYKIENVWLEFDAEHFDERKSAIFLGLPVVNSNLQEFHRLVFDIIDKHKLLSLSSNYFQTVHRLIDIIGPSVRILNIGAMPWRENSPLRLLLADVKYENILLLLQKIAWPGDINKLEEALSAVEGFDIYSMQIEINDSGVTDNIGIECYFADFHDIIRHKAFIDRMKASNPANNEKMDFVYGFPCKGQFHIPYKMNISDSEYRITGTRQGIHHYKLSFSNQKPSVYKAYLWHENDWQ